jgi:hypothetical protein
MRDVVEFKTLGSGVRAHFNSCYKNHHESDRSVSIGGMLQATGTGHHQFGGDWSGHRGVENSMHDPGHSVQSPEAYHAYTAARHTELTIKMQNRGPVEFKTLR